MLRLGLISDVHADVGALESALTLLAREGAEKVVCLGDLVEKGDQGDAVVSLLQASWIPCVRGNHDDNAVTHSTWPVALLPEGYEDQLLTSESIAYLDELPPQRVYEWEGERLLLVHATPSSLRGSIFHQSGQGAFAKRFKKDLLRSGVDAILLGHTHTPMKACYKGIRIFNPGSVCRRRTRDSYTCAILSLPSYEYTVYDIASGEPTDAVLCLED